MPTPKFPKPGSAQGSPQLVTKGSPNPRVAPSGSQHSLGTGKGASKASRAKTAKAASDAGSAEKKS